MCWNYETSVIGAGFSTIIALFLISRRIHPYPFYGLSLLGITSMQWAEAYLWYKGDVMEACTDNNRFGTQILVPFAVMLQPVGPYLAGLITQDKKSNTYTILSDYAKYYLGFAIVFKGLSFLVYYATSGTVPFLWITTLCTTVTEQGYLYWGAPDNIKLLLLCLINFNI